MCWCNYWNQMYSSRSVVTIHILLKSADIGCNGSFQQCCTLKAGPLFHSSASSAKQFFGYGLRKIPLWFAKKKRKENKSVKGKWG